MTQQNMPLGAIVPTNGDGGADASRLTQAEGDDTLAGSTVENNDRVDSADADRAASYGDRSDSSRVGEHAHRGDLADTSGSAPSSAEYAHRGDMADTSDARDGVRDGVYDDSTTGHAGGRADMSTPTGQGQPGLVHDLDDPEMPDVIPIEVTDRAAQAQGVQDPAQGIQDSSQSVQTQPVQTQRVESQPVQVDQTGQGVQSGQGLQSGQDFADRTVDPSPERPVDPATDSQTRRGDLGTGQA